MRKVFLESLPRGGSRYIPKHRINWNQSVGYKVPFIYDDINGELEIINCFSKNGMKFLTIMYEGRTFEKFVGALLECKIANILGLRTNTYIHPIETVLEVKSGKIKLIEHKEIKNGKKGYVRGYVYECLKCKHKNHITEGHLKEKLGCPVCMGQIVKIGLNDMWTTNPVLASKLNDLDDGYKFAQNSNIKLNWKCPRCQSIVKNVAPSVVKRAGLSCKVCSDGISYPEKIMYNVLLQLECDFETEKIFDWCKDKRYDFYLSKINTIIETHGRQHYEVGFKEPLKNIIENDLYKKNMALNNNISKYIIIDARLSEIDFIKNSIMNSELNHVFDLTIIDWELCDQYATSTLVKTACDFWNNGIHDLKLIGKNMHLNRNTVRHLLKKGSFLGWCNYSVEAVRKKHLSDMNEKVKRKIICLTTNEVFDSIRDASQKYKVADSSISKMCRGGLKSAGKHPTTKQPLVWKYLT
jgi:hypothetical protein